MDRESEMALGNNKAEQPGHKARRAILDKIAKAAGYKDHKEAQKNK